MAKVSFFSLLELVGHRIDGTVVDSEVDRGIVLEVVNAYTIELSSFHSRIENFGNVRNLSITMVISRRSHTTLLLFT